MERFCDGGKVAMKKIMSQRESEKSCERVIKKVRTTVTERKSKTERK